MTNILFKVIGGPKIGMGHVFRSVELATEFKKDLEGQIVFHAPAEKELLDVISGNGFKAYFSMDEIPIPIDIAIVDQLEEDPKFFDIIKKRFNPFIVALDYFNYENKNVNLIVNLFNHNLHFDPRDMEGYYEGVEYAIIRDSFKKYLAKGKSIKEHVKEILIAFGGADPSSNTIKILNLLEKINGDFKINVVLGPLFKGRKKIKDDGCKIYQNVPNMGELMFNADLGFSGAGTTMMEFCAIGTPAIVLPQNEREERFAKFFEKNKAVKILSEKWTKTDKMYTVTNIIGNKKIREEMNKNQKQLIDGQGKERIRKIVMESYAEWKKR